MRKRNTTQTPSHELLKVLAVAPSNELAVLWFQQRQRERDESGLTALMEKFESAQAQGLDINEDDKTRLLALLLTDRLRGTGGYPLSDRPWTYEPHNQGR